MGIWYAVHLYYEKQINNFVLLIKYPPQLNTDYHNVISSHMLLLFLPLKSGSCLVLSSLPLESLGSHKLMKRTFHYPVSEQSSGHWNFFSILCQATSLSSFLQLSLCFHILFLWNSSGASDLVVHSELFHQNRLSLNPWYPVQSLLNLWTPLPYKSQIQQCKEFLMESLNPKTCLAEDLAVGSKLTCNFRK